MRILVTGKTGQLAMALAERAAGLRGTDLLALGRPDLDLENAAGTEARIRAERPDLVVNAAAYTAVDKAETETGLAFAINRDGAAAAARAAAGLGVPFIHISTDYVFDGTKPTPYVETDATSPINAYGRSKLAGEDAVLAAHPQAFVFRTSWVYSPFGANFVRTMLRLGAARDRLRIVADQTGNPTSALDLADAILAVAPRLRDVTGGLFNVAGTGSTSWHGFAEQIFAEGRKHGGPSPVLEPITTAEFGAPAPRPANSRLDTAAFAQRFGVTLPEWQTSTAAVVARLFA